MKKIVFCLLSGVLILFSSCQSDELTIGGKSTDGNIATSTGKAVKFTISGTSATVRTHFDSDGNIKWSNNDKIRIVSPVSYQLDDSHQHAHYTIGENGGVVLGSFNHVADGALTEPIVWNDANEQQHFYGYYPAEVIDADPLESRGAITDISHDGFARFHIPSDQSLTAGIIPEDWEQESNPLAYAVAVTKNVTVDEERSVALQFHDIMNLLRIHVNNPSDQLVKGVEVSLTNGTEGCVAGSACVEPTSSRHAQGEPELYSDLNIWCEESPIDPYDPVIQNYTRNIVALNTDGASNLLDLYYDIYLLPQYYYGGELQITVMIGDDNNSNNDITKVIPSDFRKSTMKRVRIDIPKTDREYMGVVGGHDLYVATGNLIAEYHSVPSSGANIAPRSYYIAGTVPGKSLYTANNILSDYPTLLNMERDLFKRGIISDSHYWVNDDYVPTIEPYQGGESYSGDPDYDLVRYALRSNWRTPTRNELDALTDASKYALEWQTDYKGVSGLNGFTISTIPGITPGINQYATIATVFLPATGTWEYQGILRGNEGYYWTSTIAGEQYAPYALNATSYGYSTYSARGSRCFALRPVSNTAKNPTSVEFGGNGGWIIQKNDEDTTDEEEVL